MKNIFMILGLVFILMSCSKSSNNDVVSCTTTSVFKAKYTANVSYNISAGCVNSSGYSTLTFNYDNDSITLTGNSVSPQSFSLSSGGGGCSANKTGGDTWANGSNDLGTQINSTLQVNSTSLGIACNMITLL